MVIPALIGGAAAIGAGALTAGSARRQNRMQMEMAREQMAFQERMSSTAYQRAMADMRKAGLNPILAYQQGGASSPGGAQAQIVPEMGPAVSSAMHAKRLSQDLRNLKETEKLIQEQRLKTFQEMNVTNKQFQFLDSTMRDRTELQYQQRVAQELQNDFQRYQNVSARVLAELYGTGAGRALKVLQQIPGIQGVLPAIGFRKYLKKR